MLFRATSLDSITAKIRMANVDEINDELPMEEFEVVERSQKSGPGLRFTLTEGVHTLSGTAQHGKLKSRRPGSKNSLWIRCRKCNRLCC